MLPQGDTPLIMATKRDMDDIVKLLLDKGVDINAMDKVNNNKYLNMKLDENVTKEKYYNNYYKSNEVL